MTVKDGKRTLRKARLPAYSTAMIYNIIDRRKRPYRWREINAIIEATSHDNSCQDADQQPATDDDLTYDERENISLHEAIAWATDEPSAVTLYFYDKGEGTS